MARFRVSPLADADLDDIWYFIAADSEDQADKFIAILTEKFALLANHPFIGRDRSDMRDGIRSFPHKRYVIFYFPTNYGIEVHRVLHGARDIPASFSDETE
jgi:toxin ParE1/3/4